MAQYQESWSVTKPSIEAAGGVVVSQHFTASRIGAAVLEAGGNAIDAAIAAGFAIGAVEPWMSGLGGCGNLLFYSAKEKRCHGVSFGVRAGASVDPSRYPLAGGSGSDLFTWPAVVDDRNVHGPLSVAVPGYVAGMGQALDAFGSMSFSELLQPAIGLAREGIDVDWYTTLKIASSAALLARYPSTRDIYLPGGHPPAGEWGGPLPRIELTGLAATLERLADAGPDDFYNGDIAASIVRDASELGMQLDAADLSGYAATRNIADVMDYAGHQVFSMPGLTAGPTLQHTLRLAGEAALGEAPDDSAYGVYTRALIEAYDHRLQTMGDANETVSPSSTTHLSIADRHGNVVSLTQTLLSVFGSRVVLPESGILMNNGIMWFDPRPGQPNSVAASRWPLSNMCPVVVVGNGRRIALGASGGRRIMPAVFQLISFLTDHGMTLAEAMHTPRIDVSGSKEVSVDTRLHETVPGTLPDGFHVNRAPNGVYPALYACPNLAEFDESTGTSIGSAFITSPVAEAAGAGR